VIKGLLQEITNLLLGSNEGGRGGRREREMNKMCVACAVYMDLRWWSLVEENVVCKKVKKLKILLHTSTHIRFTPKKMNELDQFRFSEYQFNLLRNKAKDDRLVETSHDSHMTKQPPSLTYRRVFLLNSVRATWPAGAPSVARGSLDIQSLLRIAECPLHCQLVGALGEKLAGKGLLT
jgi:hypothetical protein